MFELDDSEIKVLANFLKKAPFQFRVAHGRTLNLLGFHLRGEMIKQINSNMTVRKQKFVEGSFKVETTRATKPINQQQVEVGSINRRGFSGWDEQQLGKKTKKENTESLAARGGSFSKIIKKRFKLRNTSGLRTESKYQGRNHNHQVLLMMREMSGPLQNTPFILRRKTNKLDAGMYMFKGKKLIGLRTFGKKQQPKRFDWSGRALDATKRNFDFRRVIFKEAEKQLPFLRRR